MKELYKQTKQSPYFSIILPIYNVEKYLDRCVKSILAQDFTDFELILVDDGSKDNCPEICEKWKGQDSRIKVIHKENNGLGMARNSGLDIAAGKYAFFIDSDDYILPGLFKLCERKIEETQAEAIFYGFSRVDANGKEISKLIPTPDKLLYSDPIEIKNKLLPDFISRDPRTGRNSNIRISAWNCCLNISLLKDNEIQFPSERQYISEDLMFYLKLFNCLHKVAFLRNTYYCYCQNEGSLTFSYKTDRYNKLKYLFVEAEKYANIYGYNGEVQLRLKEYFIANVMGCLKMEAGNSKKVGIIESYNKINNIINDNCLINALKEYPLTYYNYTWKLFKFLIVHSHPFFLYFALLLQYKVKGI